MDLNKMASDKKVFSDQTLNSLGFQPLLLSSKFASNFVGSIFISTLIQIAHGALIATKKNKLNKKKKPLPQN